MQRKINEGRAKKEIANYLIDRDDAFFSSVVIACLGNVPEWQPIIPNENLRDELNIEKSEDFGFLGFDTNQKYFVLDGQHRLFAIREIITNEELFEKAGRDAFLDQGLNVILVSKGEGEDAEQFNQKYRRLFTSLNRYAKSTNTETNIIMDEDDAFAICTRNIIRRHPAFEWQGDPEKHPHLNIESKGLAKETEYLTSLATLYDFNKVVLKRDKFINTIPDFEKADFIRNRPDEDFLEACTQDLLKVWDALIEIYPNLVDIEYRRRSRNPNAPLDSEFHDDLFLRPLGLKDIIAPLVRSLLSKSEEEIEAEDMTYAEALMPLKNVNWDIRQLPFRDLLLINESKEDPESTYTITAGGKAQGHKDRVKAASDIAYFLTVDHEKNYTANALNKLKTSTSIHTVGLSRSEKNDWWDGVLALRDTN